MGTSYPFADFLSVIVGLPIADRNVKVLRPCESARGRAAPCRPAAVRFGLRACHSACDVSFPLRGRLRRTSAHAALSVTVPRSRSASAVHQILAEVTV